MLKISNGRIARAQKVVLYGSEGIGKSTLAAMFPNPLFIDTEGGTAHMDVRRIAKPGTWVELMDILNEVSMTPDICGSLVIDTADWAEQLAVSHVCAKYKKAGLEDFGYGKGHTYLAEEFTPFFRALDRIIGAGIHVVVTAHAKMRKFEQPDEMGAYDRWEMKLSKQVAPLFKEWCDMLLFLNYQTYVVTTENKSTKAQGGKRVIYTSHHPCWDAKNRHGLPEVLDLDYENIAHIFEKGEAKPATPKETPLSQLRKQMAKEEITDEELRKVIAAKTRYEVSTPLEEYPDSFITGWVQKYWEQIKNMILTNRNDENGGNDNV